MHSVHSEVVHLYLRPFFLRVTNNIYLEGTADTLLRVQSM